MRKARGISPLLANIYLHYVFDLWMQQRRRKSVRGSCVVLRYADDIVVGFKHRGDAEALLRDLPGRLSEFGLSLHPAKTRLLEFGRFAAINRRRAGKGKPETFDFLGFTHIVSTTRDGRFVIRRQTVAKRLQRKLRDIKRELRRRWHEPVPDTGRWLRQVLQGYYHYFAVPYNLPALSKLRYEISRAWLRALRRRSQKARKTLTWDKFNDIVRLWLPTPRIVHPWPSKRFRRLHPR